MHILTLVTVQVPELKQNLKRGRETANSVSHSIQDTEFAKTVTESVATIMDRYDCNTCNPDYLTFVDQTKEVAEGYTHSERNGIFVRNLYGSMTDYAEAELGIKFCEEQNKFGYYNNPNMYHDGYEFGGRWHCLFLVKESCSEYLVGSTDSVSSDSEWNPPKGYRWVCVARKKDIEWQVMYDWCSKTLCKDLNFAFVCPTTFEAFVQDSTLVRSSQNSEWSKRVNDFISSIEDDTVLVGLDCHGRAADMRLA